MKKERKNRRDRARSQAVNSERVTPLDYAGNLSRGHSCGLGERLLRCDRESGATEKLAGAIEMDF
jgi:hypothetical protein